VSKNFRNYIRREKKRLLVFFSAGSISFGLMLFFHSYRVQSFYFCDK